MTAPPYGFPLILFPYFYLFDVFLILFKSSYFCYFPPKNSFILKFSLLFHDNSILHWNIFLIHSHTLVCWTDNLIAVH